MSASLINVRPACTTDQAPFEILLFCHDPTYGMAALGGGCSALIVDWEWHGKNQRQVGYDTEINMATDATLSQLRKATVGRLITRINNVPGLRTQEATMARELGSDEVWLPMVRRIAEVEECLAMLEGRASLGIQVETREGLTLGRELERLPISGVYIGLNDLRIDRGGCDHLFSPLIDGTIDRFRDTYSGRLGVAGVTAPEGGEPVAQRLLMAAMARLGCSFGVARRSFRRDVPASAIKDTITRIQHNYTAMLNRSRREINSDHLELSERVTALERVAV